MSLEKFLNNKIFKNKFSKSKIQEKFLTNKINLKKKVTLNKIQEKILIKLIILLNKKLLINQHKNYYQNKIQDYYIFPYLYNIKKIYK